MDAELLQLQRLFEAAQEAKASVRLSDRNVVELVSKLQELGLLHPPLLHTASGKEYLTQDHLRFEMELEIKRLGRTSLIDLANTIGVDLYHCERQADSIVASCSDLMLVQGEIISTGYWDVIAEEINESLQEAGQVALADLAARLNVGSELLRAMLEPRLGKFIHGKLEGGQLYTEAYVARLKAMIRGAVRALTVPTNLSTVWASLQQQLVEIDESSGGSVIGEGKLFQSLFNGLVKEGAFSGSLGGGGSIWMPAVFEKAQHQGVESFYSQNSYISYDVLRRLAISQPKQFLQAKYTDGIALETVFVHSSLISMVDAAIEEAVDGGGWIECASLAPPIFSSADVAKLVSLCPFVQKAKKESRVSTMAETCVISTNFLKALLEKLNTELKELVSASVVKEGMFAARSAALLSSLATSEDGRDPSHKVFAPQSKSGKKKGASLVHAKAMVSESFDDDNLSGKGSRGKKKGGKTGKGGHHTSLGPSYKGGKGNVERSCSRDDEVLSENYVAGRVLELVPELEDAGIYEDGAGMLSRAIAVHLRPSLVSSWESLKQASFNAAADERRQCVDALQRKTDELYATLQLFTKALDLFDDDHLTLAALNRHLLRTTGSELVDVVLHAQELERRFESGEVGPNPLTNYNSPLSTSEKLLLAKGLDGAISTKCIKLVEALDGKVVEELDTAMQVVADECGMRLKKIDKKGEKSLLTSYRKELASEVDREMDPIALLPKVVALLFVQVFGKALQAPGRAIAAAINRLQKAIPHEAYTILQEYQAATVALLSMMSTAALGGTDCTSDRIEDQREKLASLMPKLKEIVAQPGI